MTEEQMNRLIELSKIPELNIFDASQTSYYYGLRAEQMYKNLSDELKSYIDEIEEIMKSYDSGFVSFGNFTKSEPMRIRYQTHYDASFTGVAYLKLEYVSDEDENGQPNAPA